MSMRSLALQSISIALLMCIMLAILGSISFTADAASFLGVPGAWIGIRLFGEGHDWEHLAGILVGELIFFTFVCFIVLLARRTYVRVGSARRRS